MIRLLNYGYILGQNSIQIVSKITLILIDNLFSSLDTFFNYKIKSGLYIMYIYLYILKRRLILSK